MHRVLTSKNEIFNALIEHPERHIYELGDLDDGYFAYTTWYAWGVNTVEAIALVYTGQEPATLIAIEDSSDSASVKLLDAILSDLPRELNAHVSPGLVQVFETLYSVRSREEHLKMIRLPAAVEAQAAPETPLPSGMSVARLAREHIGELRELYAVSYPHNWFDPDMFANSLYYGVRHGSTLVAASGTHVYSKAYGVAALGNITTHPHYRGRGLATAVSAALCDALSRRVEHIGLNVQADNHAAIAVYRKLGFVEVTRYCELQLTR